MDLHKRTKSEADKLLNEWVKRLHLEDWRIKLNINCTDEDTEGNLGLTAWQEVNRTARINMLDEDLYERSRIVPYDWEKTLVHELLHLKTCLLTDVDDSLQERVGHMLIDDLARALVDAKRS